MSEKGKHQIIASGIDPRAYGKLLTEYLPSPIRSKAQNRRAIAVIRDLMAKGKQRTREESALLGMLAQLVHDFESPAYDNSIEPHEFLKQMLIENGLKQSALLPIFKHRSTLSQVLNGKRGVSRTQAKALAEFFKLPVSVFI
jgi:HTH-type transcriptional regulator / antitoxin HigA